MSDSRKKIAPCQAACPAGIDVPRYISQIRAGDFDAAVATVRERIPFTAVCGYACFHPCEARCARQQFDEPVAIRLLKRAAFDLAGDAAPAEPAAATGRKVAVVGSGPCGMSAAYYLALKGHAVEVLEAAPLAGGMLRYGIPEYRLPNGIIDRELAHVAATGVKITTDAPVDSAETLLGRGFDAVLVAIGAWTPVKLGVVGEDGANVLDGIDFLQRVNRGEKVLLGERVVVVGGGNTAIDAARTSIRLGAATTMLYRRTRAEMPASAEEIAEAEEEGLSFVFSAAPRRISKGSVECVRLQSADAKAGRRSALVEIADSDFEMECTTVIVAAGQKPDATRVNLATGRGGTASVDGDLATSVRGVFAAGDVVTGPSTIIDAIASGRKASVAVDRFLGGDGNLDVATPDAAGDADVVALRAGRLSPEKVAPEVRTLGFCLVEKGYDAAAARKEAARCLACQTRHRVVEISADLCKSCGYCEDVCTPDVFSRSDTFNAIGYQPMTASASERCMGCLKCFAICPDFAINIRAVA